MKILIGISTGHIARQAIFYDYYHLLEKPEGTGLITVHGQSPARGRNIILEQALEHGFDHVFLLDDDMAYKADLLTRLIAHGKDVVTGYYLMRNYPHQPVVFDNAFPDGRCTHHFTPDEETGLIEIVNCGLGACLIKTSVLEGLEKPWVRLGELEKDHWCDDIGFFLRLREKGIRLYCDLDAHVGHMHFMTIWPRRIDDKWVVSYDTYGKSEVSFPSWKPTPELVEQELAGVK